MTRILAIGTGIALAYVVWWGTFVVAAPVAIAMTGDWNSNGGMLVASAVAILWWFGFCRVTVMKYIALAAVVLVALYLGVNVAWWIWACPINGICGPMGPA